MEASAALFASTRDEPAVALPAAALGALRLPCFVANYFGEKPGDGMHTADVSRNVARSIPGAECVVATKPKQWFVGGLVRFVESVEASTGTASSRDPG